MSLYHQAPEMQQSTAVKAEPPLTEEIPDTVALPKRSQSAEEGEALLLSLQQEVQRRSLYGRLWLTAFVGWGLLVFFAYLLQTLTGAEGTFPPNWVNLIHLINAAGLIIDRTLFRKSVAAKLAQLEDVAAIGSLTEVLGQKGRYAYNTATRKLVSQALTRLLPRVTADEAAMLSQEQRAILRNVLKNQGKFGIGERYEADFLVAILKALAQIGDTRCLPQVQELARFAEDAEVRKAAASCLPHLQEVVEQERNSQTLLRAASAAGTPADLLLRPAHAVNATDPDQLLRATSSSEVA